MFSRLNNYLRSYRRRSGLSQNEVAFLLGSHDGGQVSRYEKGHRLPPLRTALAFTAILGVSIGTLFSGIQLSVDKEIITRTAKLRSKLEKSREHGKDKASAARKLHWLDERWPQRQNHSDSTA